MQPSKRISIMKSLVLRFLCVKHFLLLIMHGIRGFGDDMLVQPALHLQLCNFAHAQEKPFKICPSLTATTVDTETPFFVNITQGSAEQ